MLDLFGFVNSETFVQLALCNRPQAVDVIVKNANDEK